MSDTLKTPGSVSAKNISTGLISSSLWTKANLTFTEYAPDSSFSTLGGDGNGASIPYNASFHSQTNDISGFVWFKSSSSSGTGFMFNHGGSTSPDNRKWNISFVNGVPGALVSADGSSAAGTSKYYTTATAYNDNQWHFFGFTFVSNTFKIYLDGLEVTGGDRLEPLNGTVNTLHATTLPLGINTYFNGTGTPRLSLNGRATHYSFWDKVLSDAEVLELYNKGRSKDPNTHSANANLVAFYPITGDTIVSGTLTDDSGNGQDATIVGTATIETDAPPVAIELSFDDPLYIQARGLAHTDNIIPIAEAPIFFDNNFDVAYVIPNKVSGAGNLSVIVDSLVNVPDNAKILAYRFDLDASKRIVINDSVALAPGNTKTLFG